jgi:ABC-type uncharacterized transport system auxiliary subunit
MKKRFLVVLCLCITFSTLAGCNGNNTSGTTKTLSNQEIANSTYPLNTDEELTVWRNTRYTAEFRAHIGQYQPQVI